MCKLYTRIQNQTTSLLQTLRRGQAKATNLVTETIKSKITPRLTTFCTCIFETNYQKVKLDAFIKKKLVGSVNLQDVCN